MFKSLWVKKKGMYDGCWKSSNTIGQAHGKISATKAAFGDEIQTLESRVDAAEQIYDDKDDQTHIKPIPWSRRLNTKMTFQTWLWEEGWNWD